MRSPRWTPRRESRALPRVWIVPSLVVSLMSVPAWSGEFACPAGARFELHGGERIVFFGDSITQSGRFIADLETFLVTRFPDATHALFNHGLSSETISGTSETDHHPRRPDAHERFTRDVTAWRPDLVVACFGMNDGNYHPFDPARFARYQDGIRRLIERTRDQAHARLALLSPPPFDPYRRITADPNAREFGYKFPAIDYDRTLEYFSHWLCTVGGAGGAQWVVDIHSSVSDHLTRRRVGDVSFFLAADAVHPGPTGHWLMAQALLLAWHAPAHVAEAGIDAGGPRPARLAGEIKELSRRDDGGLRFIWRSPLPMPIDPDWDRRSIELEQVADRLNRYRMMIKGLDAPRYRLVARFADDGDETDVGVVSRAQLEQGVDLTGHARFPTVALAGMLRKRVLSRRLTIDTQWRTRIARQPGQFVAPDSPEFRGDDPELTEIHRLARPRDVWVSLVPIRGS